jgi:phage terminase large subunit-like protein
VKNTPPEWAITNDSDRYAVQEKGCYWDDFYGDDVVAFAHKYGSTQFRRGEFKLYEWQERWLRRLYSWRTTLGNRRWRVANLGIAKKAGKTLLVSLLSSYELFRSREPSPWIYAGAATAKNAGQIFREIRHSLHQSGLDKHCRITPTQSKVYVPKNNATFQVVSREGSHGENCTLAIIDEAWKCKPQLNEALRLSGKDRKDFCCIYISTAGNDVSHWYHSIYLKSKRIKSSTEIDYRWMADIYEMDPDGKIDDPVQWHKANPSPFDEDEFGDQLEADSKVPALWLNTQQMYLNKWVSAAENSYLDVTDWEAHEKEIDDSQLAKCDAWTGTDTSSVCDPSSVVCIWHLGEQRFHVRSWAWVPEDGSNVEREAKNLPLFRTFPEITETPGNRIDDREILSKLLELNETYNVRMNAYDPASGGHILLGRLEDEGYTVAPFAPTYRNYNGVLREFHKAYHEGRITFDKGSGWLKYCFQNMRIRLNESLEQAPYKRACADKIDGAIATLVAFITACQEAAALDFPQAYFG